MGRRHPLACICQLVVEQLARQAVTALNQFSGQVNPAGAKA